MMRIDIYGLQHVYFLLANFCSQSATSDREGLCDLFYFSLKVQCTPDAPFWKNHKTLNKCLSDSVSLYNSILFQIIMKFYLYVTEVLFFLPNQTRITSNYLVARKFKRLLYFQSTSSSLFSHYRTSCHSLLSNNSCRESVQHELNPYANVSYRRSCKIFY